MRRTASSTALPDIIGGTLLFLVGLAFLVGGTGYGLRTVGGQLEPGAMPFLAGCLLAVLGPAIAITAGRPGERTAQARSPAAPSGSSAGPSEEHPDPGSASEEAHGHDTTTAGDDPDASVDRPRRSLMLFALTAVAVAAITWIDIFVVLSALVIAVLVFFERVRLWKAFTTAVVLSLLCYLVFAVLLGVPLPTVF